MRILVVEDDREVAEYIRRELQEDGYSVAVCHDGAAGLRAAERAAFDLIVLDVMLPFLDAAVVTSLRTCRSAARGGEDGRSESRIQRSEVKIQKDLPRNGE